MPASSVRRGDLQLGLGGTGTGDVFVFHSDGLTEAWNGKEEFGSARLSALVAKHAKKPAAEMGDEIEKTLRNWAREHLANDDVTFVIVRVA